MGIASVVILATALVFMFDRTELKMKVGIDQQENWREELNFILKNNKDQKDKKIIATLRNFADKIDQCQNFGEQAMMLDFEFVDMNVEYKWFDRGHKIDGVYYPSEMKSEVAVFRDNDAWAGKINEYEIDLKKYSIGGTYEVASMRQIDDPSMNYDESRINGEKKALYKILHWSNNYSKENIRKNVESVVKRCMSELIENFDTIENSYEFSHTTEDVDIDNNLEYESQNHILRWQKDDYIYPEGSSPITSPFLEVVTTNAGHILSYESNLSFFGYKTLNTVIK